MRDRHASSDKVFRLCKYWRGAFISHIDPGDYATVSVARDDVCALWSVLAVDDSVGFNCGLTILIE